MGWRVRCRKRCNVILTYASSAIMWRQARERHFSTASLEGAAT
jgi:hypothetical protein